MNETQVPIAIDIAPPIYISELSVFDGGILCKFPKPKPNWWWRFWYWALLGWKWKDIDEMSEYEE